jgi:hypothetical protein
MQRFQMDNTEGYTQSELDEMNRAFAAMVDACPLSADTKSWQDHLAEQVQFFFDQGQRGADLIRSVNAG